MLTDAELLARLRRLQCAARLIEDFTEAQIDESGHGGGSVASSPLATSRFSGLAPETGCRWRRTRISRI